MKKILILMAVSLMSVTILAGCSNNVDQGDSGNIGTEDEQDQDTQPEGEDVQTEDQDAQPEDENVQNEDEDVQPEEFSLSDIVTKIQEEIGIAMGADIDDTLLKDIMGVNPEDVEEYAGQLSMVMTSADNFLILEAKEGKAEDVKAALETRLQTVIDSAYTPTEIAKANAGIVYENGNILALIVVGNTEVADGEDFDTAKAEAEVEKAEEIINSFFN